MVGTPSVDFGADFGDEGRKELFVGAVAKGLVGREPAMGGEKFLKRGGGK